MNDVLAEDCTKRFTTQIGKVELSILAFSGMLKLTPPCDQNPKLVIGDARVTVVLEGTKGDSASTEQSRFAARVLEAHSEESRKRTEKVENMTMAAMHNRTAPPEKKK